MNNKKLWGVGLVIGAVLILGSAAGYLLSLGDDDALDPKDFEDDEALELEDDDIARMLSEDTSEGAKDQETKA